MSPRLQSNDSTPPGRRRGVASLRATLSAKLPEQVVNLVADGQTNRSDQPGCALDVSRSDRFGRSSIASQVTSMSDAMTTLHYQMELILHVYRAPLLFCVSERERCLWPWSRYPSHIPKDALDLRWRLERNLAEAIASQFREFVVWIGG